MYEERTIPWWTWLLYAVALIQTAVLVLGLSTISDSEGSVAVSIIVGVGAILFWFLAVVFGSYFVRFDGSELAFGYRYWNVAVPVAEVTAVTPEDIRLMTFGGFGWRMDRNKRIGYVIWTGPAVEVKLKSGRCYVASCESPAQLIAACDRTLEHPIS